MDSVDSAYVFAGGASSEVALYDLRMTDGTESRVIQKYRPSGLESDSEVSVSGLDVSKDKRELLVSYENDQVRAVFCYCLLDSCSFVCSNSLHVLCMCRCSHFQYFQILQAVVLRLTKWKNTAIPIAAMGTALFLVNWLHTVAI